MRVHELAKDLDVSSKELMDELERIKAPVKHHSATLDEEIERKLRMVYQIRRGGGGIVKKVIRRAGRPAEAQPPSIPRPTPPTQIPITKPPVGQPMRPIRRFTKSTMAPQPLSQPPTLGPPPVPVPEGPTMAPITPPAPFPPPQQTPAPAAPPSPQAPSQPSPAGVQPLQGLAPSPTSRRPVKRQPKKQEPNRRGTAIDLDTLKSIVTPDSTPERAERRPARGRGRRRDGHTRRRDEPKRDPDATPGSEFKPSFLLHATPGDMRRDARRGALAGRGGPQEKAPAKPRVVTIYGQLTLGDLAERLSVPASDLIRKLMEMGEIMTINTSLSDETAELLAESVGIQLTIIPETDEYDVRDLIQEDKAEDLQPRPPIVTVMGHVDHGKTSLLDRIRSTSVAEGEAGGITQHIGASCVETPKGPVTFLDTPGHEAFTAMRARGAHVTDLVVLVIAADDGIKPQTIEAINHAKAAGVPILIALNKMDLPGANPERAKQELMNHSLVPEDFGGDTIVVPVSAKTGDGVERLLEMLALQSEILELRANPNRRAEGVVIESQVEPGRGVTATALVLKGTLRIGDVFLCGPEFGKIRSMRDDRGQELEEIVPGRAAEITGLRGAPPAGETFLVVPDEKAGRLIAETRSHRRRTAGLSAVPVGITMEETEEGLTPVFPEKERASFKLIIRADVQGSVEAVRQSLTRLEAHDLKVEVLHSGVGSLTVSDVNLAMTTGAALIGFGVRPEPQAAQLAEQNNVTFHLHRVIYELIDDIRATIRGVLEPEIREEVRGRAEVRKMFRVSNVGNIAGCFVTEGELQKGFQVRLIRDGVVVTDKRKITSLRRFQDDVNRVQNGNECGVSLEGYRDIRAGDILEAFTQESIAREVTMAPSGGGAS